MLVVLVLSGVSVGVSVVGVEWCWRRCGCWC